MAVLFGLFIGIPLFWAMIRTAKFSAPITACVGLAVLSVGITSEKLGLVTYGGGLFLFSSVLFVLGGGMRGR